MGRKNPMEGECKKNDSEGGLGRRDWTTIWNPQNVAIYLDGEQVATEEQPTLSAGQTSSM